MIESLNSLIQSLGIPIWLFVTVLVWIYTWKLIALWTAARKQSLSWFIILALFNTMGILEIVYVMLISKMECCALSNKKKVENKKQKKKSVSYKRKRK